MHHEQASGSECVGERLNRSTVLGNLREALDRRDGVILIVGESLGHVEMHVLDVDELFLG
jgi:hypothetical protein